MKQVLLALLACVACYSFCQSPGYVNYFAGGGASLCTTNSPANTCNMANSFTYAGGMALDETNNKLFLGVRNNVMMNVDVATYNASSFTAGMTTGGGMRAVAYDNVRKCVYYSDPGVSKKVFQYDYTTGNETLVVNTGAGTVPGALAIDTTRNILYVGDSLKYIIRAIDMYNTANITILGGIAGNATMTGDGGHISQATLGKVAGLTIDKVNNLMYIQAGPFIRVVDLATGIINAFAGNGSTGYGGDGDLAVNAMFDFSDSPGNLVTIDNNHNRVYIAQYYGSRIRMVDRATGIVSTVVGDGTPGYNENLPASQTRVQNLLNIAYDNIRDVMYIYTTKIRVMNMTYAVPTTTAAPTPTPTTTQTPTTLAPTTTQVPTTTIAATTTVAPTTTTLAPTTTTVAPTSTATPVPSTGEPADPTTTPLPTTTVAPTTATPTTAAPTTTTAVTTTSAPTTTATPTTTTVVTTTSAPTTIPTTVAPTTSTLVPTTTTLSPTSAPTTTLAPTTAPTTTKEPTPAPTLPPQTTNAPGSTPSPTQTISYDVGGTGTKEVVGDITQVPPATVNGSVVLFSNANVTVTMSTKFTNATVISSDAIINSASISFSILHLSAPADIAVIFKDLEGNYGGNATQRFTSGGQSKIDITQLYKDLLAEYKKSFTLVRAIRGNILKVNVGIVTPDVAVEIDPVSIKSTTVYSIVQQVTTTVVPTTTKGSLSGTSTNVLSLFVVVLAFILL